MRTTPLHPFRKVMQRTTAPAQAFYPKAKSWRPPQKLEPLRLRLSCRSPHFLAKVLLLAVRNREAAIKASNLTRSWTLLLLLRYRLLAYDIQALVPHLHPHLPALCDEEVTSLTQPPDGYHSHLRWDTTGGHSLVYPIDRARRTFHS